MAIGVASELAAAAARRDVTSWEPVFHAAGDPELLALARDPGVVVVDQLAEQLEQLARARAPRDGDPVEPVEALDAPWVFYPWSRRLVHVLPEALHRELRFDRNRYAITPEEQRRLGSLTIAVAGLSVGRAVVTTLAHEGIGGELRLADFDALDLSNLNRVTGGIADVGINKVVLAAREVAELDPYIRVVGFMRGVEEETISSFVEGVDVIVDECDGLEIKLLLREHARAAGRPVVMATSWRGMLDVERFDLEPSRPGFHGLLGDVTAAELAGLTTKQKIPYVLRILDPQRLSERTAASLMEVKESLSTWPQLASEVTLGGAQVANAVRRIALGELTVSGRFYTDLDELVAGGNEVPLSPAVRAAPPDPEPRVERDDPIRFIVACATTAPSGGNMQPWRFEASADRIRARIDPSRSSLLDFRNRAALLAIGAALEAAEIGARAIGFEPSATLHDDGWELALEPGEVRDEADLLWRRGCNRRTDGSGTVELHDLVAHAAPLLAAVYDGELRALGAALGALDRVRFLSARLRDDMVGELRFPGEDARDGIDVASLELDASDLAAMDVLRTGAGMALLAKLDRGWGLGNLARDAFAASGGALILRAHSAEPRALVDGGRGLMRLWLEATRRDLAIHPWGSPFLFQRLLEEPGSLEPWERDALVRAAGAFALDAGRPILLVLRVSRAGPPSTRSRRRPLDDVLTYAG
jgi:molybdopterin/thiamine biosynthesis adenylyltransferase/nitroreductase